MDSSVVQLTKLQHIPGAADRYSVSQAKLRQLSIGLWTHRIFLRMPVKSRLPGFMLSLRRPSRPAFSIFDGFLDSICWVPCTRILVHMLHTYGVPGTTVGPGTPVRRTRTSVQSSISANLKHCQLGPCVFIWLLCTYEMLHQYTGTRVPGTAVPECADC